jgi:hypothetical protein
LNTNGSTSTSGFDFFFKKVAPIVTKSFFKNLTKNLGLQKNDFSLIDYQTELNKDEWGKWLLTIDLGGKNLQEKYDEYLDKIEILVESLTGNKEKNTFQKTIDFLKFIKR